jgi:ubiquinone/menaquinone biosynthesis C-methylase UbiE
MSIVEVPTPIDFRLMGACLEWESKAMARPFRLDFFEAITNQLRTLNVSELSILELGSGPGFLALYILERLPEVQISLLDFSPAMLELADKRLATYSKRVNFVERNFKQVDWAAGLGTYDVVVTIQAVHELRHKLYAEALHRQVKTLLKEQGCYLVCDHYFGEDGLQNDQLYMTRDEQRSCLASAGFKVTDVLIKGGRSLYHAA